jgi:hypothetical protein
MSRAWMRRSDLCSYAVVTDSNELSDLIQEARLRFIYLCCHRPFLGRKRRRFRAPVDGPNYTGLSSGGHAPQQAHAGDSRRRSRLMGVVRCCMSSAPVREYQSYGLLGLAWAGLEPLWLVFWVYGALGGNLVGYALERRALRSCSVFSWSLGGSGVANEST